MSLSTHALKMVLYKLRNLIDKIIAKIDKPQPINFNPFPEFIVMDNTVSEYGSNGIYLSGTVGCTVKNNTCSGTVTDTKIYE